MIKKLFTALYVDNRILSFNEDSGEVILSCNDMGIFIVDLNVILDDTNYDADDPEFIIHLKLLAWHSKFEKRKPLKKQLNEKLMLVT